MWRWCTRHVFYWWKFLLFFSIIFQYQIHVVWCWWFATPNGKYIYYCIYLLMQSLRKFIILTNLKSRNFVKKPFFLLKLEFPMLANKVWIPLKWFWSHKQLWLIFYFTTHLPCSFIYVIWSRIHIRKILMYLYVLKNLQW